MKKKIVRKKVTKKKAAGGRPPKYTDVQKMQKSIDEYFNGITYDDEHGIKRLSAPAISELAYHLNMTTETLRDYGTKAKFSATVKRAKQRIEIALEKNLYGNSVTGTIFNLKNNFGWKDKQEIEQSGQVKVIGLHPKWQQDKK